MAVGREPSQAIEALAGSGTVLSGLGAIGLGGGSEIQISYTVNIFLILTYYSEQYFKPKLKFCLEKVLYLFFNEFECIL